MRKLAAPLAALMLAACGTKPPEPVVEQLPESTPAKEEKPALGNSTLKHLAKRKLKPQPTRPLNVKSRCSHTDEIGTRMRLDLLVKNAEVKTFAAQVTMQEHGACRFDLKDFEQVEKLPQPLLRHKLAGDCTVRMWEQGSNVTIAFNSCPSACEGKAFDYLWPLIVDARNGRCY
ncbi:MAG: hypothetical protein LBE81_11195 [Azonexus sp.]|jgi:uncharacterized protein YcfL|uniref:hypothetical protein n=1 Tax=Azonexus sp. TaxID=1872668 RepID=UPI0028311755|nr:hypothetical protein [Azonexus sp.]MDR0777185.1 hypothetical protein [Azonexus sp.]